jgi:transcriptional repressor NrdR
MPASLFVIKKDGRREEYDRDKVLIGIRKACEKRPLEIGGMEKAVDEIEAEIFQTGRNEISSAAIGEMVMARLKQLDHIAYIRFASVYREFADITMLKEEVDNLANHSFLNNHDQLPLIPPEEIGPSGKIPRRLRR